MCCARRQHRHYCSVNYLTPVRFSNNYDLGMAMDSMTRHSATRPPVRAGQAFLFVLLATAEADLGESLQQ